MKKWETLNKLHIANNKWQINKLIRILLENRGIKTKKEIEEFLNPKLENVTPQNVGIDKKELQKTVERIKKAIKQKEKIVVFGDYDVDGICGTAILWETLHNLGADVMPYIPHRIDQGYGLSEKGIEYVILNLFQDPGSLEIPKQVEDTPKGIRNNKIKLIITTDNGIVANTAVDFAREQGIDVIITDHHIPPTGGAKKLPKALAIVHTTSLCGAGVTWVLTQEIRNSKFEIRNKSKIKNSEINNHLELVTLGTVADLVPLLGFNRTLVKFGLEELKKTKRVGLLELFKEARLNTQDINVYEIGHIIAPRLNAMGRLEYAMDSLRLLCTNDKQRAKLLAEKLGATNRQRQELTEATKAHASARIRNSKLEIRNLLFLSHETYQQGVIGLVAGKLVEEFYRPAIVVSVGDIYSKASARSIRGFNIIEFIRSASEFLIDSGGHPMAAGFTVETKRLSELEKTFEKLAEKLINKELLTRSLKIDCQLPLSRIDLSLYNELQKLAPFGMGNPEPTFMTENAVVKDVRIVGRDGKHLKLRLQQSTNNNQQTTSLEAIAFGMGETKLKAGDSISIAYTIDENEWPARNASSSVAGGNGSKSLQLKIKDIKRDRSL
ncbi:MAG: DHH family phosphoesterase [Candidatus Levyibacteriota bacterium]